MERNLLQLLPRTVQHLPTVTPELRPYPELRAVILLQINRLYVLPVCFGAVPQLAENCIYRR